MVGRMAVLTGPRPMASGVWVKQPLFVWRLLTNNKAQQSVGPRVLLDNYGGDLYRKGPGRKKPLEACRPSPAPVASFVVFAGKGPRGTPGYGIRRGRRAGLSGHLPSLHQIVSAKPLPQPESPSFHPIPPC